MKNLILIAILFSQNIHSKITEVSKFKLKDTSYVVEKLTDGHGIIWGMEFISPDKILFSEISGKLSIIDLKTQVVQSLKNLPKVFEDGQGGLLDVALHPDFQNNNIVFVTYSKKIKDKQTTAAAFAKLDETKNSFDNWKDFFIALPHSTMSHHYGSRITFDSDNHLFMTVGERGAEDLAQSLEAHNGKVIRLNLDGSVPKDNPFVQTKKALPEIWSYGHRNQQGIFFDTDTSTLYAIEHGPMGGDEINVVKKAKNYGWPIITYGRQYTDEVWRTGETKRPNMEEPIKYYVPSIAPSSLIIYKNGPLEYFNNKFLAGALALEHLNAVSVNETAKSPEDRLLVDLKERIRDVKQGPDGLIYVSSDTGRIYRISKEVK